MLTWPSLDDQYVQYSAKRGLLNLARESYILLLFLKCELGRLKWVVLSLTCGGVIG